MTTTLRPTPARLALLQAVADEDVHHWPAVIDGDYSQEAWDCWVTGDDRGDLKVTARITELVDADLIRGPIPAVGRRYQRYELAAAGRAVLDDARKD